MRRSAALHSFLALAFMLATALAAPARAAQDTTVIQENAPVRLEPNASSKAIEYLAMGVEVRISSFPMLGGWYKVRSKTGVYGWIHESFLSVYKPKPESPREEYQGPRPERDRKWHIRMLGAFDFFRPDDLNTIFAFQDLNTGYTIGGEIGTMITDRIALEFRAEALVKDIVAKENQSGTSFNLALRAYPLMGGLDFYFTKLPAMRFSMGIFGGLALSTSFATEAVTLRPPNVVVLEREPFTSLLRFNLTRPLGRIISVFMELGYRFLRTEDIDTSSAQGVQGGSQIYAKDGVYRTRVIDLSGIEAGVGLGIHF